MRELIKNKKIKEKITHSKAIHCPQGLKKVESLALIIDRDFLTKDRWDLFQIILQLAPTDIHPIFLGSRKGGNEALYFDRKQINRKGEVQRNSDVERFISRKYDLLINYYSSPTAKIALLSAVTQAGLKVGFPTTNFDVNDLDIHLDLQETQEFLEEIKKYLSVIN